MSQMRPKAGPTPWVGLVAVSPQPHPEPARRSRRPGCPAPASRQPPFQGQQISAPAAFQRSRTRSDSKPHLIVRHPVRVRNTYGEQPPDLLPQGIFVGKVSIHHYGNGPCDMLQPRTINPAPDTEPLCETCEGSMKPDVWFPPQGIHHTRVAIL